MTVKELPPDLSLLLTWRHGYGALTPFFEALREGRLIGARCPVCGLVTTPPRTRCGSDGAPMQQIDLPPTGIVTQLTTGAASSLLGQGPGTPTFALVQITGSDTRLLARLDVKPGQAAAGSRVRLMRCMGPVMHPVQALVFRLDDQGA